MMRVSEILGQSAPPGNGALPESNLCAICLFPLEACICFDGLERNRATGEENAEKETCFPFGAANRSLIENASLSTDACLTAFEIEVLREIGLDSRRFEHLRRCSRCRELFGLKNDFLGGGEKAKKETCFPFGAANKGSY